MCLLVFTALECYLHFVQHSLLGNVSVQVQGGVTPNSRPIWKKPLCIFTIIFIVVVLLVVSYIKHTQIDLPLKQFVAVLHNKMKTAS